MSKQTPVFIGIDVACASGKRLPICVVSKGKQLMPLEMDAQLAERIPRGVGNAEIGSHKPFQTASIAVVKRLLEIAQTMNWRIVRVAIDAPAAAPLSGSRASEVHLGEQGLSSFRTPDQAAWKQIGVACRKHLDNGGKLQRLPYANKIWMLFGFELFTQFRARSKAEVIEVYPYAIARALVENVKHKSTADGYRVQLAAVARRTSWRAQDLHQRLRETVFGAQHDRLDAYMAAWIASLDPSERCFAGDAHNSNDQIWSIAPSL